jgi:hypothetical protein
VDKDTADDDLVADATDRSAPRDTPARPVRVSAAGVEDPMDLLEIGLGGFSILCPRPFDVGAVLAFSFDVVTLRNPVVCEGRVIHCRMQRGPEPRQYIIGWRFVAPAPEETPEYHALFEAVTKEPEGLP